MIVGHVQRQAHGGCQGRLEPPRRGRQQPLGAQAAVVAKGQLAVERLGLVTVARHQKRAALQPPAAVQALGPGGPARGGGEIEGEQVALPERRLGHGRQHARGDPGGRTARPAAVEHERAQVAPARAAGDGESGDAGPDDDEIRRLLD